MEVSYGNPENPRLGAGAGLQGLCGRCDVAGGGPAGGGVMDHRIAPSARAARLRSAPQITFARASPWTLQRARRTAGSGVAGLCPRGNDQRGGDPGFAVLIRDGALDPQGSCRGAQTTTTSA